MTGGSEFAADECLFEGGFGIFFESWAFGGHGLVVSSSRATIARSSCVGGSAAINSTYPTIGGSAAVAQGTAVLRIAGTTGNICTGGTGFVPGAGLTADASSSVIVHGAVAITPTILGPVTLGAPALPYLRVNGSLLPSKETNAALPVTVDLDGIFPNALYFFVVSDTPDYVASAPWGLGDILLSLQAHEFHFGLLDATGHLTFTFVPAGLPALLNRPLYSQAGVFDAATGLLRLSQSNVRIFSL